MPAICEITDGDGSGERQGYGYHGTALEADLKDATVRPY